MSGRSKLFAGQKAGTRRTRIKICGVTRPEDATWLASADIDAVGLNFHPGSSRFVSPAVAKAIVAELADSITVVGVFVDRPADEVAAIAAEVPLSMVQLHGYEPLEDVARLSPVPVIKAFRFRGMETLDELDAYCRGERPELAPAGVLIDAYQRGHFGGTGESWDWSAVADHRFALPWLLAGGITPENVADAIRRCRPNGIDLASGVESAPGKKDPNLVRSLVERVRTVDASG